MSTAINTETLYQVLFKNGNSILMTGSCLLHCYLNSIDDTVERYEEITDNEVLRKHGY